ncbi:synphilin-1 [Notolabrus celidotus]|uniref:synphilin-1 n=1 Tax=Notolabrus celidotus TaxID=1203425 RepID=UPI00148F4D95|nr:synphilin-1 [Notolabrus celidotus]XP_034548814.1 synphilin-1 [Notolabrus celidotus]
MEAPEYLDLDEIDFSDDTAYSVTSLKSIPELSRRSDGQAEERPAPAINWSRGVSSHSGGGIKPTGLAEVHSKFRPVKRVSPLKHQPETTDSDSDGKVQSQGLGLGEQGESSKDDPGSDKQTHASSDAPGGKPKSLGGGGGGGGSSGGSGGGVGGNNPQALFGELEHYDLDMDEILDVPYIKSSQQMSTLPRVPHDKRSVTGSNLGGGTLERTRGGTLKSSSLTHNEPLSLGSSSSQTQYCVLSPVKWSDLRKSKSMDPDLHHLHRSPAGGGYQSDLLPSGLLSCSSSLSSFSDADKLLSARVYPDSQSQRTGGESSGGPGMMFPLPSMNRQDASKTWTPGSGGGGSSGGPRGFGGGGGGEVDEETKKNQNIINIVREGQISLLPHLAADNLELIRDEDGNNLLHISACQGHADCLQHLTSLMGEDSLNERNNQQLTPAGLGVKNGHLECVRWMVSETEAIAELSCTREHPSLIHYAGRYGQEKVLLWLLQFMQEQAISLDEVDQNGNTAVHVAAQYGHLTCIQTLVEYGSNVTVQNQQGERPSQSAERQGHTTCARYLVVVETCMSLASQVVKLTKQLNEQAADRMVLQKQLQRMMEPSKAEGTPSRSPSSHQPPVEAWPEMLLTAEGTPGEGHWMVRQAGAGPDSVLRQLLGKDMPDSLCPRERPPPAGSLSRDGACAPGASGARRPGLVERRELKLARLKQIMQRSLSESDTDGYPPEEGKTQGASNAPRPDRPSHLPIAEEELASNHGNLMKQHLPSSASAATAEKKIAFTLSGSKSVDSIGYNPSPTSSDPEAADAKTADASSELHDANGQKVATSPKSALKSPSSRRKTSQNLKLRVTFDEQVHKSSNQEAEQTKVHHGKERTSAGSSESKRSFGAFRSIMETLSGNTNHNNNSGAQSGAAVKPPACQNSPGRKSESKGSPGGGAKGKSRTSNV